MRTELCWIAIAVWIFVLLGFIGPWLISAESSIAVSAGAALIGATFYALYRYIRRLITQRKSNA